MENNLYKKLRFFALCLAIICMILSLIKRAKADEYETSDLKQFYIDYLKVFGDQINPNFDYDTAFLPFTNGDLPYSFMLVDPHGNCSVVLCKYDDPVIKCASSSTVQSNSWGFFMQTKGGNSSYPYDFCGYKSNHNISWSTLIFRVISVQYYGFGTSSFTCSDFKCDWNESKTYYYATHTYINSVSGFNTIGSTVIASTLYPGQIFIPDDALYYGVDSGSSAAFGNYEPYVINHEWNNVNTIKNIPSTNTDGLKVYKQTIHNTNFLYVDYSDCVNIVPTYLEVSSLFGNIDIDGSIYEIDYDSTSQYYHINNSTGKVYYQIPFNALSLNDENITSAVLNDVVVAVSWSTTLSQGDESLLWVTPIYLIGSPHDIGGFTPDSSNEQPQETYTPEMNAQYYLDIYSMYNDGHTGDPFVYNENLSLYSSHQLALDSVKMLADVMEMDTWYINSVDKILYASNTDLFGDYIYDNGFGLYYDAIIFDVYDRHVDGVINPVNVYKGTGVLYTERYYTRNGLKTCTDSLKDIITYDRMCSDYLYLLYDVTYKKLRSLDNNTAEFFNNQGIFNSQVILFLENINSFLPDISGLLNDILDALKDLQLSQLDTIDTKLSTIIDNMTGAEPFNEDDTIAEAIAYYQSHTQSQAVFEDKYSVWFTGYCHFWLQEYGEEEPVRNRSSNVNDFASSEKRHIIFRTFKIITNIYDKMKEDLLFNRVEEMFDYFLDTSSDVSHTRRSYFYDIFDEQNTPTIDYNPYE